MARHPVILPFCILILLIGGLSMASQETMITLPSARESSASLEKAIRNRRSVREYTSAPLALEEVAQLLWAAQGITGKEGGRAAPSAGALYPMEVCVVVGKVEGLAAGLYRYVPDGHRLAKVQDGDFREALMGAALGQDAIGAAPATIVITAEVARCAKKYGERARRYVDMEAGHISQNIYLQAVPLGLGTVAMGAFDDARVGKLLGLRAGEEPLYLMPVGRVTGR